MASVIRADQWQSSSGVTKNTVIQVIHWQSPYGEVSVAASATTSLGSQAITVQAGSKVIVHWWTSQYTSIPNTTNWNGRVYPLINGSTFPYAEADAYNHIFYDDAASGARLRHSYSSFAVSAALTGGTYTIDLQGSSYNQAITFNYQSGAFASPTSNRRARMLIMEVAG